jgi:hypothetical protein
MMVMKMVRILINLKVLNCDGDAFLHIPQEAQARFARARLCLPYNEGRKETLRPK